MPACAVLSAISPAQVIVTGTLDRRLLLLQNTGGDRWMAADLSGQPHQTRTWPAWASPAIHLNAPESWLSTATFSPEALGQLSPRNFGV
ncbi:MAG: hypothetical protein JO115_01910 [Pseudonocardiales bacterium]|nr:hypothetical protein [Pseudonocardiales bacterium]